MSTSYYLTLLPSGADPAVGSNWREVFLGTWSATGTSTDYVANAVAANASSILVLGKRDDAPYVWSWAP